MNLISGSPLVQFMISNHNDFPANLNDLMAIGVLSYGDDPQQSNPDDRKFNVLNM